MSCLAPCPTCQRHVSTHETACPFCAAPLPESFRCQPARVAPSGRLSRAAMVAAGTVLLTASCGNAPQPAYGVAIDPDAGADSSTVPIYGAAPPQLEQASPPADEVAPAPAPRKN